MSSKGNITEGLESSFLRENFHGNLDTMTQDQSYLKIYSSPIQCHHDNVYGT